MTSILTRYSLIFPFSTATRIPVIPPMDLHRLYKGARPEMVNFLNSQKGTSPFPLQPARLLTSERLPGLALR